MDVRRLAPALLLASSLAAQSWTATSFFPSEYRSELRIDLARMRQLEVLDGIERSMLAPLFAMFEPAYGFPLADVAEIKATIELPSGERKGSVLVMSGAETVTMPTLSTEPTERVEELEIGGHAVKRLAPRWEGEGVTMYCSPRDGMLVQGDEHLVRPALSGEHKGGVPAPELLRHTTGRDDLAWFATYVNDAMRADMPPGTADWVVAEDPLTFVMVRLRSSANEDDDDLQITIEALLQCERGTTGPELLQKKIEAGLQMLQNHRRLGALKRYWKNVVVERDGRDVSVSLALGRPRQAAGSLAQLLAPWLLVGVTRDEAAAPAPVATPPGQPKKDKDEGKKDGG